MQTCKKKLALLRAYASDLNRHFRNVRAHTNYLEFDAERMMIFKRVCKKANRRFLKP